MGPNKCSNAQLLEALWFVGGHVVVQALVRYLEPDEDPEGVDHV